jgi:hypothetical protein
VERPLLHEPEGACLGAIVTDEEQHCLCLRGERPEPGLEPLRKLCCCRVAIDEFADAARGFHDLVDREPGQHLDRCERGELLALVSEAPVDQQPCGTGAGNPLERRRERGSEGGECPHRGRLVAPVGSPLEAALSAEQRHRLGDGR